MTERRIRSFTITEASARAAERGFVTRVEALWSGFQMAARISTAPNFGLYWPDRTPEGLGRLLPGDAPVEIVTRDRTGKRILDQERTITIRVPSSPLEFRVAFARQSEHGVIGTYTPPWILVSATVDFGPAGSLDRAWAVLEQLAGWDAETASGWELDEIEDALTEVPEILVAFVEDGETGPALSLHDAGEDWYRESGAPRYGLSEDFKAELLAEASRALADGDGTAYLNVLRRVADECQISDVRPDVTTPAPDPADQRLAGRLAAVRELRPVLEALYRALGRVPPEVEPVHVHEVVRVLREITEDVEQARAHALWLAALNVLSSPDLRARLLERAAGHGGIGLDLPILLAVWQAHFADHCSAVTLFEIGQIASKLRGAPTGE